MPRRFELFYVVVVVAVAATTACSGTADSARVPQRGTVSTTRAELVSICSGPGEATVTVPDVEGLLLADAILAVRSAGLNVQGSGTVLDDPDDARAIVRVQKPEGGALVPPGACVGFRTKH